jgi:excisionase family DNA binding protein
MTYFSYADVAAMVGVTSRTIETQVQRGDLKPTRIGNRNVRFTEADIADWVRRRNAP